ncbi:RRP12-like protein [Pelodiscus sinensis]|uniref:RRP12-like protein n=1 Tax=Pelodiscus sinensis TaxID=13735 RepID=UPI003F6D51AB
MGKAGRLRSGAARGLQRWRKGHSSESNPAGRRHRRAARPRLGRAPDERSNLTVDALKLHNELQSGAVCSGRVGQGAQPCMEEDGDGAAVTEKSAGTFLSGLTDCTNVTFSKVQRFWASNSASHKEICAVLAAVTEVIRAQGGTESETEYFAALMTTLEAVESPESLAAVAYLLNLVLKRVPGPVLIKKFSDVSKVFMGIMASQAGSGPSSALRWVLSCLATLLRKQDLAAWSCPLTMQVYHGLLSFTVHAKPKVSPGGPWPSWLTRSSAGGARARQRGGAGDGLEAGRAMEPASGGCPRHPRSQAGVTHAAPLDPPFCWVTAGSPVG